MALVDAFTGIIITLGRTATMAADFARLEDAARIAMCCFDEPAAIAARGVASVWMGLAGLTIVLAGLCGVAIVAM